MKNINLRKVPDGLYTALKVEAATKSMRLGEVCISHLMNGVGLNGDEPKKEIKTASKKRASPVMITEPEAVAGAIAIVSDSPDIPRCSECGSVGRVHQKNCSRG